MMDGDTLAGLCRFMGGRFLLGKLAVLNGFLSEEQLASCLAEQKNDPRPLGAILLARRVITSSQLSELLHQQKEIEQLDEPVEGMLRMIGHYAVVGQLGSGGAGDVSKAWDTKLHRWVAIKEPRNVSKERFLREARAAAKLRHPNLIETFEGGEYIVMNFVDGKPLDQAGLDERKVAAVMAEICDAVHYMHSCGVLHRDLKPQNIIVDADGRGQLGDFGLAKDLSIAPLTLEGKLLGTPCYMAPEQAAAKPVDARTDVYGLGATLYHALAGRPPFEGDDVQVLLQRLMSEEPPPIPGALGAIARHAMAKEPGSRYRTAGEMGEDLRRWLRGEPIVARPPGALALSWRWLRRRPWIAAVVAIAVLVALFWQRTSRESEYVVRFQEGVDHWMRAVAHTRGRAVDRDGLTREAEAAIRKFDEAADASPGRPEPWLMRGRCLLILRRGPEAEAAWTEALGRDPLYGPALLERGKYYVGTYVKLRLPPAIRVTGGRVRFSAPDPESADDRAWREKGIQDLSRARLAKGLDPLELRYIEGALAFGANRYAEAAKALREYVERNSWDASALSLHAAAAHLSGESAAAEDSLTRAINLEPRPDRYKARGDVRYCLGQFAGAVADYDLSTSDALCNRGLALQALDRFEEAIDSYTRAGESPRALNNRGTARLEIGEIDAARKDFERALEQNEFYAEAYNNLGSVLVMQKKYDEGIRQYELAIGCDPEYGEAYANRARAWIAKSEHPRAIADFEEALKRTGEDASLLCELALAMRAAGDARAVATLTRAIEIAPKDWNRREAAKECLEDWK